MDTVFGSIARVWSGWLSSVTSASTIMTMWYYPSYKTIPLEESSSSDDVAVWGDSAPFTPLDSSWCEPNYNH